MTGSPGSPLHVLIKIKTLISVLLSCKKIPHIRKAALRKAGRVKSSPCLLRHDGACDIIVLLVHFHIHFDLNHNTGLSDFFPPLIHPHVFQKKTF